MFEQIITRFQRGKIILKIDHSLQSGIVRTYQGNSPVEFGFSLFDLVCAIGSCKTVATTKANKFPLASDYLKIFSRNDSNELRLVVNDDHTIEQKQEAAKYVGEGLSWIIAEKLYDLEKNSMSRIKRSGKQSKPDFRGNRGNFKVVWEAKGSINTIRKRTIVRAKKQKTTEPANVAFASLATLIPQSIAEVSLEDPPPLPLEGEDLKRKLSKVMHYVKTFNFIGQARLSRYFELLGKRLERDKDFPEFSEKIALFEKIRAESVRLTINCKSFLGNIERVGDSVFLYAGFDENLLSVQGFSSFEGYEEFNYEQPGNSFRITRDGICYGYLRNLGQLRFLGLAREINVNQIPYYRDTLSIRDLDSMLHFQLVEYVGYLFEREEFDVRKEILENNKRYDMIVNKGSKKVIVEVKKRIAMESLNQLKGYQDANVSMLITIGNVSEDFIRQAESMNIIILDRKALKAIIKKQKRMSDFFE